MTQSIEAFLLGAIQGLTEFIPVSSTAHVRILSLVLGKDDPGAAYSAIIQLGTLLSLLVYFRKDIIRLITDVLQVKKSALHLCLQLIIATLPIAICGLLFEGYIKTYFRHIEWIASALIIVGIWMGIAEYKSKKNSPTQKITFLYALLIGIAQAMALVPGVSRSGATLAMALFLGFRREQALYFSFFLSIPAIALAGMYQFYTDYMLPMGQAGSENSINLFSLSLSTIVAAIVGYGTIAFLFRYLRNNTIYPFVIYRILIAILLFFYI